MRLFFEQKAFNVLGDSTVYNENGDIVYTVKGRASWGHILKVYDANGHEVGTVKQVMMTFLPKFDIYLGNTLIGTIKKESVFSFAPTYSISYNGWTVEGSKTEWDYIFRDRYGYEVARAMKEAFKVADKYTLMIDETNNPDPLTVLMFIIAIDAEKASRS